MNSNPHTISGKKVVVSDKVYAYDGNIYHDEHKAVAFEGWVTFIKNTAVRSVSQQGVD